MSPPSNEELERLIKHIGCGDSDNYGMCSECNRIREILANLQEIPPE